MSQKKTYPFTPNWCIPTGEYIREHLEECGRSQAWLAARCRRPVEQVNRLINGRIRLDAQWALALEKVFRRPATFWWSLEGQYRLGMAKGLKVCR